MKLGDAVEFVKDGALYSGLLTGIYGDYTRVEGIKVTEARAPDGDKTYVCEVDPRLLRSAGEICLVTSSKKLSKAHEQDAGWDIWSAEGESWAVRKGVVTVVSTGLRLAIPPGWAGFLEPRSGLASKGIVVLGGTIDSGYDGEIKVCLSSLTDYVLESSGEPVKIVQIVFRKVDSIVFEGDVVGGERGENGFGSSGLVAEQPDSGDLQPDYDPVEAIMDYVTEGYDEREAILTGLTALGELELVYKADAALAAAKLKAKLSAIDAQGAD